MTLCVDHGPTIDGDRTLTFGRLADRTLQVEASVRWPRSVVDRAGDRARSTALRLRVTLLDGSRTLAGLTVPLRADSPTAHAPSATGSHRTTTVRTELAVGAALRGWSPRAPHLYTAVLRLVDQTGHALDRLERRIGFRDLVADGRRILWNGTPLAVRGILHWGIVPDSLAPTAPRDHWRRELEDMRGLGFNLVKCCLWVPPQEFLDLCDALGMLVWQEYPTWHPELTERHRDALVAEFDEFYAYDRSHPAVAIRSLTCETGHGADLGVLQTLFQRAKASIPDTLIIDDSSWISWSRLGDFYDDHPYGNNSWWPGKLAEFDRFIAARTAKPLLLGECITSDTWFDAASVRARAPHIDRRLSEYARALCADAQTDFMRRLRAEFPDAPTESELLHQSVRTARRDRKYQIERLRMSSPDTGYVVSVIRDFRKARMGLYDDLGRLKHAADDWAWHRDTVIGLDTPRDRRAFAGPRLPLGFRIAHHGPRPHAGSTLDVELRTGDGSVATTLDTGSMHPGSVSVRASWRADVSPVVRPTRRRVTATLRGPRGARLAENRWELWQLPAFQEAVPRGVRVADALDPDLLAWVRAGGRLLLRARDARAGAPRTRGLWYLRGKSFAPTQHPLHAVVPAELLRDLQTFDLERPRLLEWEPWRPHVDPILAFWDTHDLDRVDSYVFAFDTGVGRGRLLVHSFHTDSAAGRYVEQAMLEHLAHGPAPRRSLPAGIVDRLARTLTKQDLDLSGWHLRPDPEDRGTGGGWATAVPDRERGWQPVRAGSHWENQGHRGLDGIVWYRTDVEIPPSWANADRIHAVFDGVDDSFRLYLDGQEVARFGDPETGDTVWLQRVSAEIGAAARAAARAGRPLQIALRIVDHAGAGGLWKPARLTTGPPDGGDLLH